MIRTMFSALPFVLLATCAAALEPSKHLDVHIWPLSEDRSQLFATIEYNSTAATIKSTNDPSIPSVDNIVRVGYYAGKGGLLGSAGEWSGIVTAASNFAAQKEKTILIQLDNDATAYHIGFKATDRIKSDKSIAVPELRAEVVPLDPAPVVHLNKPIVLAADGQVEKPAEKTFLQKYWWAIAAFLVLQVVMGGAGGAGDKKE